ncbi:MAG TPA: anthranilate synthase component I, partial [Deinococcales bacterium]|nr:anthranilate synthase component I [Deinococcales bacterium]
MHTPDRQQPAAAAAPVKPVYREVLADLETPLTALLKIGGHPSFLLESVEQGEQIARWSFIGSGQRRRIEAFGRTVTVTGPDGIRELADADPLEVLWAETVRPAEGVPELPGFWSGFVGYASYDLVRTRENLPADNPDELGVPDLLFIEPEVLVIFDHFRRRIFVTASAVDGDREDERRARELVDRTVDRLRAPLPGVPGDRAGVHRPFTANFTENEFRAAVSRAVDYVKAGEVEQVVPSLRLSA